MALDIEQAILHAKNVEYKHDRVVEENNQLRAKIKHIRDMLIKIVNDEDDRKCAEWDQAKKKKMKDAELQYESTHEEQSMIVRITRAVRQADIAFEKIGGSTRHWVIDCFLPALEEEGIMCKDKRTNRYFPFENILPAPVMAYGVPVYPEEPYQKTTTTTTTLLTDTIDEPDEQVMNEAAVVAEICRIAITEGLLESSCMLLESAIQASRNKVDE